MPARKSRKDIFVIYHKDCLDGFGAVWAAWKKFGAKADYLAALHNDPLPRITGKRIYFLDMVPEDKAVFARLRRENRVTALDHHASMKAMTESTEDYRYATDRSGAVIAWQYFHPGKPTPLVLRYIEDMDLWSISLPKTQEIRAVLELMPFDLKIWNSFISKFEDADFRKQRAREGALLRRQQERLVQRVITNYAELVRFEGHVVYAVNATLWTDELSHALYEKHPPFAIVWRIARGRLRVSLRGIGKPNLLKYAKKFGGGGHEVSCGFIIPFTGTFPWKAVGKKKKLL